MEPTVRTKLAQELMSRIDRISDQITDEAIRELPEFLNPSMREIMRSSVYSNIELFKEYIISDGDRRTIKTGPALRSMSRTLISRGQPLSVLLMLFHGGHNKIEQHLLLVIHEVFPNRKAQDLLSILIGLREMTNKYVAQRSEQLAKVYSEELSKLRVPGDPALLGEVTKILRDGEAPEVIGTHQISGPQQAFILWNYGEAQSRPDELVKIAGDIALTLGAEEAPLTVFGTPKILWAWCRPLAQDKSLPPVRRMSAEGSHPLIERLESILPANIGLAAAPARDGLEGFRQSHRHALRLRKLAEHSAPENLQVVIAGMEGAISAASLVDRLPIAAQIVAVSLGELAIDNNSANVIRQTARSFHRHGIAGAAEELNAHRNTVKYRMDKFREVVGKTGANSADVRLALELAHWYGSEVLRPSD